MKTYTFKVIIEEDFFDDGREAYHAYAPALKAPKTLKRIIEEQAEWTEADLRRLKLLK